MTLLSPVEWLLARRYLRARRGFISITTWFAIIGIALGVATLILVTSLMNGIRDEMTSRFIGLDGHVTIYSNARAFTDYQPAREAIAGMPGVARVTPKVTGQVMVTAHGAALGAQAVAMPWDALSKNALITSHVEAGALDGLRDETGIVLGAALARNLRVEVGDSVTLISPQGRATIAGFIPRMKAYPVIATVKLGMHALDASLVIMPFIEAQNYFMLMTPEGNGAISNLEVMLTDVNAAHAMSVELRKMLGAGARVYDWQQSNASVFAALTIQRNVMVIILALIILVAAFNIISSLVMLVKEKGRDIAVLRTMGASRASVMRIFMAAGTWIGVVGTVAGVLLGLLLAAYLEPLHHLLERVLGQEILVENIYFLSTLPTKTDPREVAVIIVLSLGLSFLATIYPARRAASLDPAEALRYE
ncbi:MAG: lipoprotein-releasing ABC transporter permease subunit [Alphaproteobacteria bacterium]|nr:lipoprotein-releasing ABC transporter permease subunit [Alphaproteobacteria bacterium]